MKQHITMQQFIKLDNMSKFSKKTGISEDTILYEHVAKIITIGKMIEILSSEYIVDVLVDTSPDVVLRSKLDGEALYVTTEDELCDALWEAIKFMFENLEE